MERQRTAIDDAIAAVGEGRMVIVTDDSDRENEADLVIAAEAVTPEAVNFMIRMGRGLVCTALAADRVAALDLPPMPSRGKEPMGTAFTTSVDARDTTTGISAAERAHTIRLLADPSCGPDAFVAPGHVFPLRARPGGILVRPGHTEAGVDLARLGNRFPAAAICEIIGRSGQMLRPGDAGRFARHWRLPLLSVAALVHHRLCTEPLVRLDAEADFPTRYGRFRLLSFVDELAGDCHLALVRRTRGRHRVPLVRLHSECLTGDALGSLRCDCGSQLAGALAALEQHGHGALIYLRQEGRGIGLSAKLRAYQLQDRGLDTVDANVAQGLPVDARDYALATAIIRQLGWTEVELLTNNPSKQQGLERYGIGVKRTVPLPGERTEHNSRYLDAKRARMGHLL